MSIHHIVEDLEKLVTIHESLLNISVQKTEIVKEDAIAELQHLLIKERKQIQILEQTELKRKQNVNKWFLDQSLPVEEATITKMLELLEDERERKILEQVTISLTEVIVKLKQQEQLNQALIQQSLQFVQFNMEMINPSLKSMNYGTRNETPVSISRSVFDSKA